MGFFDEIAEKEQNKHGIEEQKKQAEKLYKTLNGTYRMLEETVNYSTAFKATKEKAFKDFKNYFEGKGFTVTPSKISNVEGFTANAGEIEVEFIYNEKNEFNFRMTPIWAEYLNIEDFVAGKRNFQGYEYEDELHIRNIKLEDLTVNDYKQAIKDIQKDIDALNARIGNKYTPKFTFHLPKRGIYVENLGEYLELLNRELKQSQ